MIVKNLDEARRFLPSLNLTVENTRLDDFLQRAQEWVVQRIIGSDIEALLEAAIPEGQTDQHAMLRKLVQRVIAEQAYLTASSELDVQLSEAGFVVQSNDYMKPAFDGRVDRLCESLRKRVIMDCDALVKYLGINSKDGGMYVSWRGSEQFAYLTQAFAPTTLSIEDPTSVPQLEMYNIFLLMQPKMAEGLRLLASRYVSLEEIERLLELYRDDECLFEHRVAIKFLRKAAVQYARGNMDEARRLSSEARKYMKRYVYRFPAFAASDEFKDPEDTIDHGKIVNFL